MSAHAAVTPLIAVETDTVMEKIYLVESKWVKWAEAEEKTNKVKYKLSGSENYKTTEPI